MSRTKGNHVMDVDFLKTWKYTCPDCQTLFSYRSDAAQIQRNTQKYSDLNDLLALIRLSVESALQHRITVHLDMTSVHVIRILPFWDAINPGIPFLQYFANRIPYVQSEMRKRLRMIGVIPPKKARRGRRHSKLVAKYGVDELPKLAKEYSAIQQENAEDRKHDTSVPIWRPPFSLPKDKPAKDPLPADVEKDPHYKERYKPFVPVVTERTDYVGDPSIWKFDDEIVPQTFHLKVEARQFAPKHYAMRVPVKPWRGTKQWVPPPALLEKWKPPAKPEV